MQYCTEVANSRDLVNRKVTIQVAGCKKTTACDIPAEIVWDTQAYSDYLDGIAQTVLANMDPNSPTYDPTLVT